MSFDESLPPARNQHMALGLLHTLEHEYSTHNTHPLNQQDIIQALGSLSVTDKDGEAALLLKGRESTTEVIVALKNYVRGSKDVPAVIRAILPKIPLALERLSIEEGHDGLGAFGVSRVEKKKEFLEGLQALYGPLAERNGGSPSPQQRGR